MTSIELPLAGSEKPTHQLVTQRESSLRRAFFASAGSHASWRVDVEAIVELSDCSRSRWKDPREWIEDLVVACACIRGEQEAWHHLMLANNRSLRECGVRFHKAGQSSPAQVAALMVERFWRELREQTRTGGDGPRLQHFQYEQPRTGGDGPRLQHYRGDQTLGSWLQGKFFAKMDARHMFDRHASRGTDLLDTPAQTRTLGFDAAGLLRSPTAT